MLLKRFQISLITCLLNNSDLLLVGTQGHWEYRNETLKTVFLQVSTEEHICTGDDSVPNICCEVTVLVWVSIAVKRDHDQGNPYKKKTVHWGWLTVLDVQSIIIMRSSIAAS